MQRLYSMFPSGTAGVALLILRVTAAAAFLIDGLWHWIPPMPWWFVVGLLLPAASMCVGLTTPYCSLLCGAIEIIHLLRCTGQAEIHLGISLLMAISVGMLGPGAYSVDSRLFGRRIITQSVRNLSE